MHVHLVAHPRKPQQSGQQPELSDVAGSADLGRKADNVIFVMRAFDQEASVMSNNCSPMRLMIRKQRYGTAYIGELGGWFNRRLRQFVLSDWQDHPTQYLPEMALKDILGKV